MVIFKTGILYDGIILYSSKDDSYYIRELWGKEERFLFEEESPFPNDYFSAYINRDPIFYRKTYHDGEQLQNNGQCLTVLVFQEGGAEQSDSGTAYNKVEGGAEQSDSGTIIFNPSEGYGASFGDNPEYSHYVVCKPDIEHRIIGTIEVYEAHLYPHNKKEYFGGQKPKQKVNLDSDIQKQKQKVIKLQEKLKLAKNKLVQLSRYEPTDKILNIMNQIEKEPNNVVIVMDKFEGEEAVLWNSIHKKWPLSSWRTVNCVQSDGELDVNSIFDEKILYWKSPSNNSIGENYLSILRELSSEDDIDFKEIHNQKVVIIYVRK